MWCMNFSKICDWNLNRTSPLPPSALPWVPKDVQFWNLPTSPPSRPPLPPLPPPPLQSFIVASHWVFYSYQAYTMSIHDHNVLLFCTLFISGIPFSRDWSYYVCGGDLLCIFVACYPRVQHTLGCLSFNNSSLAFDQHCFSLF